MNRRISLDQLDIAAPCPADYAAMHGGLGDAKRFCDHCQKHVHDLSLMTLNDAERLICESAGRGVCVRMTRDVAGKLITLDYQPPPPRGRWRSWRPVTASLALAGAVCAFFFSTWTIGRPAPGRVMGSIAVPLQGTPLPIRGQVEMGDVDPATQPATQPTLPVVMGEIALPTTQPMVAPLEVLGRIAMPTTRPTTKK